MLPPEPILYERTTQEGWGTPGFRKTAAPPSRSPVFIPGRQSQVKLKLFQHYYRPDDEVRAALNSLKYPCLALRCQPYQNPEKGYIIVK